MLKAGLSYPIGRSAGFNPAHRAARGISGINGLSAIASGGNFISLLTGGAGTIGGAPVAGVRSIGPAVDFSAGATTQTTIPIANITNTQQTLAVIYFLKTFANTHMLQSGNANVGGAFLFLDNNGFVATFSGGAAVSSGIFASLLTVPYFAAVSVSSTLGTNFVVANLATGQTTIATGASVGTISAPGNFAIIGSDVFNVNFLGYLSAVMFSPTYMSIPELVAWASDPWSFWYPSRVLDVMFMAGAPSAAPTGGIPLKILCPKTSLNWD